MHNLHRRLTYSDHDEDCSVVEAGKLRPDVDEAAEPRHRGQQRRDHPGKPNPRLGKQVCIMEHPANPYTQFLFH